MKKHDSLEYTLSHNMLIFLFLYYLIIFVAGSIVTVSIGVSLAEEFDQSQLFRKTFVSSLSVGSMLCSIQYVKRLYKACITDRIDPQPDPYKRLGNMAYFLSRPFFSFAFSILAVFAMLSGMYIVTGNLDYIINKRFLYLCVFVSGCIGSSVGKVMDRFESISEEKIKSIQ